jgi:F5/8 type C domain
VKREATLVIFAFAGLAVLATFPLVFHLGRALPGDLGDPLFSSWILGWDAERLRHGLSGIWDAPILFPSRHTLAFAEHLLGIAVFVAPVIWVSNNPVLAYDIAFLLTFVLAGCGMYLLARELTGRRDAAFLAGLAFASGPVRALHLSHLQVLAWGWMPIALWGLHRYFSRRSIAALMIFAAAFTIEALSNGYFLFFLAMAAVFVVAYELVSRPWDRADRVRALAALTAAAVVILVVVGAVALAYISVREQYGVRRPYRDWLLFSADVRSYVSVPGTVKLWSGWLNGDRAPERQLFPGLVTAICAVAALWPGRTRRRIVWLYSGIGATAFVLSLGPEPAAWSHRLSANPFLSLARMVPGVDGLRVPARIGVLVLLALCVLAALGLSRLLAHLAPRTRMAAVVALGVAIFAEGWAAPIQMASFDAGGRAEDRSAYRWLAQQPPGAAIELPILEWSITPTLTYQYATLAHGHPIVNGYSGYGSPLQEFFGGAASPLNDLARIREALDLLRAIGVRYVVVHQRDYADAALGAGTAAAIRSQPGTAVEGFHSDAVDVFRLRDADTAAADSRPEVAGTRLHLADFHADASDAADRLALAFDGDPDTRWLTGRQQNGDEWISLRFDRPRDVSRIELQTASRSFGDYPRELVVESVDDGGARSVLYQGSMLVPFGRALAQGGPHPALVIGLPSNHTRTLTIRQTGRTRRWFWAIHELAVYEGRNR